MNDSSNNNDDVNDVYEEFVNRTFYNIDPSTLIGIFVMILMVTAFVAMLTNVIVFVSVYWIRGPMSPILKISLSLAAADALASSIYAATLYINTYMPSVIGVSIKPLQIAMEMTKLSGILITVIHLLALSVNHYIGIRKPLHYNSIVTRRKVSIAIAFLWIFPACYLLALFTVQADSEYWYENFVQIADTNSSITNNGILDEDRSSIKTTTFIDTFSFRMTYSMFFFVCLVLMVMCYTHIVVIVRRQQKIWRFMRCGGQRTMEKNGSGVTTEKLKSSTSPRLQQRNGHAIVVHEEDQQQHRDQKQLEVTLRAIYTTLFILGSCVIGWMPALLIFVLMCKENCLVHGVDLEWMTREYLVEVLWLRFIENMLVVLKMLVNPIIYSIRMKEIQESTGHMRHVIMRNVCRRGRELGEMQSATSYITRASRHFPTNNASNSFHSSVNLTRKNTTPNSKRSSFTTTTISMHINAPLINNACKNKPDSVPHTFL